MGQTKPKVKPLFGLQPGRNSLNFVPKQYKDDSSDEAVPEPQELSVSQIPPQETLPTVTPRKDAIALIASSSTTTLSAQGGAVSLSGSGNKTILASQQRTQFVATSAKQSSKVAARPPLNRR